MNTTTKILANQYIATYNVYKAAYDRAYKAIGPDGNEAEAIESANAYQAMVSAREALIQANK